ncbi:hypothetical protein [Geothrix edaphica]|uniref:Uncharacterized protein n=1 Tax=Geothrix edaphica TaxID=2927976 RepID=A0ABQ5PXP6_9BACT|nr:hypothetical protein [Geothrix edaphica]GLH67237.1 hypothetical protein GETHED_16010 [Geothrix edaphica]
MKLSRKAKRYDDSVLPGEFQGFEAFHRADAELDGTLEGFLRRGKDGVQLGEMVLECHAPKRLSFAKLKTKAEMLSENVNYLKERLEIVDHDRRGMYIQLRSLPPYKDDTQIQFNEISLGKNKVVVKRIAFYRKEEVKQQVPLNLTELELKRLLFDIRQAIA